MLFSVSGMVLMGMANDLILVFLALELLSIPLYILSGFDNRNAESEESAMKYFLLGAFSSGFFVFGIALTYGATGSTALPEIVQRIGGSGALGLGGVAMLLVGFAFKVAVVPFHMWTPDVYEGAPTAVTAFMSVGAKVGGFAALMRVFGAGLTTLGAAWAPALAILAGLTMIVGNIAAISQQNIKRMLAYSSIANAGYIMMGVAASPGSADGVGSALFYMLAYLFTNLGVFAIVIALERHEGQQGLLLEDYRGLAKRHPALALILAYLMLSLIGIPTTSGFTAKFFVFRSAVDAGLVWLVVIGALTSVVSAFYYIRPVYYAYMYDGPAEANTPRALQLVLAAAAVVTLVLGFAPMPWFEAARQATLQGLAALAGG
jgi:NADH-quinone oxidoreductase subunit N